MIRFAKRCRRKGLPCGEGWVKVSRNSLSRRKIVHSLGSFVLSQHSTRRGPPGETIYHAVVSCPRRVTLKRSLRGAGTRQMSGWCTTGSPDFWEGQGSLPIESLGTTSYPAAVTFGITTPLVFALRVNATPSYSSIPPFELDVGQNASAAFAAHVELNSTFTAFFRTMTSQNVTDVSSTWHRDVLSRENVTVEAGTFSARQPQSNLSSLRPSPH